jgi:hypothetical protein
MYKKKFQFVKNVITLYFTAIIKTYMANKNILQNWNLQ